MKDTPVLPAILELAGISLAIAAFLLAFNSRAEVTLHMQINPPRDLKEAVYDLHGTKMVVTLQDAKDLLRAFSTQLDKQKHDLRGYPRWEAADPRIDPDDGIIYFGAWALLVDHKVLVLTQRAPAEAGSRAFYRLIAKVKRDPSGSWMVEPVAVQRVFR